jgi:hypothetical protein
LVENPMPIKEKLLGCLEGLTVTRVEALMMVLKTPPEEDAMGELVGSLSPDPTVELQSGS